jgi:hypothetical protein
LQDWLEESELIIILASAAYLSSTVFALEWRVAQRVHTPILAVALDGVSFEDASGSAAIINAQNRELVPQLVVDYVLQAGRKRVFISYSRRDKKGAEEVSRLLSSSLSRHWIDTSNLVQGRCFKLQTLSRSVTYCSFFGQCMRCVPTG